MVGPTPFGPFEMHGDGRVFHSDTRMDYACQLIRWEGHAYLFGTVCEGGDSYIGDLIAVEFGKTGVKEHS